MDNQPGRNTQAQYDQRTATEAVQHLMSLLTRAIPQEPKQGQSTSMERPTVESEMARSFPGYFKRRGKNQSHPIRCHRPTKVLKTWKPLDVSFFLLCSKADSTPTMSAELDLMQAGLGRRTLSITSDLTHAELSSLLRTTYPKMNELEDRWLLYKAAGGHGRRKISAITLEAEGYTGSVIKRTSAGGKQILYIVPLQDELDLTPLPADAPEFALMPKTSCKQCKTVMPLQMLALHIDHCNKTSNSETEESDVVFLEEKTSNKVLGACTDAPQSDEQHCLQQACEVKCPICTRTFPVSDIEQHASFCGESLAKDLCQLHTVKTSSDLDNISCEEDVIHWAMAQMDSSRTFDICVSRDGIVERGLKLWKRQKNGGPVNPLKVSFLGEPGVDTGALRKEFLSTMVAGIEKRLFEGESEMGKVPKYSLNDLDNELFKVAGEIFCMSIAQGGPAPRFMQDWCFHYLVTGNLKTDGVHDAQMSPFIKTIEDASDLSLYITEILDCGYTGPIDIDHKESILRAIVLHVTTKRTPMLQQMREGLEVYNLIQVMKSKPNECRNLFVVGDDDKVDAHYILSHLASEMSPHGSPKHLKESKILEYFQDFLLELEDTQPEDDVEGPSVPMVMQWMTGQAHKHLLVSERHNFKITMLFEHDCAQNMPGHTICYPVVSACANTVTLPTAHLGDYQSFKQNLQTAIKYGASFDRL